MTNKPGVDLIELTVDVVSAFVSNNTIRGDDLPQLIETAYAALDGLRKGSPSTEPRHEEFTPAVSARKSLASREHIISLINGKPYKSLKRHLTGSGLTPEQYRERYKLPATYPMVAPAYSERRSEVAKRLGLGRKNRAAVQTPPASRAGRGRRKATDAGSE